MSDDPASKDGFRWEMSQHIASRLRQQPECATIAAFMQDEIEAWRQAMQKAERDIAELRGMLEVQDEMVKHYVDERDEARREVCVLMQRDGFLRGDYAIERGWDCFEEKP